MHSHEEIQLNSNPRDFQGLGEQESKLPGELFATHQTLFPGLIGTSFFEFYTGCL